MLLFIVSTKCEECIFILAIHLIQCKDQKKEKVTPIYTPPPYLFSCVKMNDDDDSHM